MSPIDRSPPSALVCLIALAAQLGCHSFEYGDSGVVRAPSEAQAGMGEQEPPPAPLYDAGRPSDPEQGDVVVNPPPPEPPPPEPPPPEPPPAMEPENDLTFPCTTDADCTFGACYVPGTNVNPICSKRCDTHADCPAGALCTGPLDCTDCTPPASGDGLGYCFRACVTNEECTAYNPIGTEPAGDEYQNPVECVHWAAIYEEPRPPAIDICIQSSEP